MIDRRTVFEIHRLKEEGFKVRAIARRLNLNRETVRKYLITPEPATGRTKRQSKITPFREHLEKLLAQDPWVPAPVLLQRLRTLGFDGQLTMLRTYLRSHRPSQGSPQAFIRFESQPGEQMQVDWGHFGSLNYQGTTRKLYALAVVESHSRMLYVQFTHCQKQEVLHQCLLSAFQFFSGTPKELVVDNMLTAVKERQGRLIRFNERFLDFLRPFSILPRACNVCAAYEKGKVERSIGYLRKNFWPLRSFSDLGDVNAQVTQWLHEVANQRLHQTTGQKPRERFKQDALKALPDLLPDCRETLQLLVHADFAVRFDGNCYTAPPWCIGRQLILKADHTLVSLYHKQKVVAQHLRCFRRYQRIELSQHTELVKKLQKKLWQDRDVSLFAALGEDARLYLSALSASQQPIKKNVSRLLMLGDRYGTAALMAALQKALHHKALGAAYIENILQQQSIPLTNHPPVTLKNQTLNNIRLEAPCLADYDGLVLQRRKKDD
jgi:transposase